MDKYEALKRCFGYNTFRPGQEEIIDALIMADRAEKLKKQRLFSNPESFSYKNIIKTVDTN